MKKRLETSKDQGSVSDSIHVLADQVGDFIQYWGFRKVEGRIWTYLFLAPSPLNAEELMKRTGISKAMLSLSLGELLKYDVIRKAYPDKERHQAYVVNPNVMEVISNVLRSRERGLLGKIHSSFLVAHKDPKNSKGGNVDSERLAFLGEMVVAASQLLDSFLTMQALDMLPFQKVQFAPSQKGTDAVKL